MTGKSKKITEMELFCVYVCSKIKLFLNFSNISVNPAYHPSENTY